MPSVQAATSTMATKKQLAAAVAPTESEEAKTKSMAALMSLLRATAVAVACYLYTRVCLLSFVVWPEALHGGRYI